MSIYIYIYWGYNGIMENGMETTIMVRYGSCRLYWTVAMGFGAELWCHGVEVRCVGFGVWGWRIKWL